MDEKILFVDDEPNVLQGIKRILRGHYVIQTAGSGAEALAVLEKEGSYSVIVSDMRMPNMNGLELLTTVATRWPHMVRMALTGQTDIVTAAEAVNTGQVYRFLTKPCAIEVLKDALDAGIKQYRLIISEKELLEKTLTGSVHMLMDVVSLIDQNLFSQMAELRTLVSKFCKALQVRSAWQIEMAVTLSQIGTIILPQEVQVKRQAGLELSRSEQELVHSVPQVSSRLLGHIPRLDGVASIIYFINKHYDGTGFPKDALSGSEIPYGSRLLRIIIDLMEEAGKQRDFKKAMDVLVNRSGYYDPSILANIGVFIIGMHRKNQSGEGERVVSLNGLRVGDRLNGPIMTKDGKLLCAAGIVMNETMLEHIYNYEQITELNDRVSIVREW